VSGGTSEAARSSLARPRSKIEAAKILRSWIAERVVPPDFNAGAELAVAHSVIHSENARSMTMPDAGRRLVLAGFLLSASAYPIATTQRLIADR
jgi:hypothetical protein